MHIILISNCESMIKKILLLQKVSPVKIFDPESFSRALDKAAGVFTAENHPEWRTKKDVVSWLRRSRKNSDRTF